MNAQKVADPAKTLFSGDDDLPLDQQLNNKLIEHEQYIAMQGGDLPEIRYWKWSNSR